MGYGLYSQLKRQIECERCEVYLVKANKISSPTESFIEIKNYTEDLRLQNPSDDFYKVALSHFEVVADIFGKYPHVAGLKHHIMEVSLKINAKIHPRFFEDDECLAHRMAILDHLTTVLLRKKSRWLLQDFRSKDIEKKRAKKMKEKFYHM